MTTPDPSLIPQDRSDQSRASDEYQEKLVAQRQQVFGLSLFVVVLVEIGLWYWSMEMWLHIVVPLFWIGLLLHSNALLILHELWEINDQLSGRKDEFRVLFGKTRAISEDEQHSS